MKKITYTSTFTKTIHEHEIQDFIDYCIDYDCLDENETITNIDNMFESWVSEHFLDEPSNLAVIFDNYDAILEDVKEDLEYRGYHISD